MDDEEIYDLCDRSRQDDLEKRKRKSSNFASQSSKRAKPSIAKLCPRLSSTQVRPTKKLFSKSYSNCLDSNGSEVFAQPKPLGVKNEKGIKNTVEHTPLNPNDIALVNSVKDCDSTNLADKDIIELIRGKKCVTRAVKSTPNTEPKVSKEPNTEPKVPASVVIKPRNPRNCNIPSKKCLSLTDISTNSFIRLAGTSKNSSVSVSDVQDSTQPFCLANSLCSLESARNLVDVDISNDKNSLIVATGHSKDNNSHVSSGSHSSRSSPTKGLEGNVEVFEMINSRISSSINVGSGLSATSKAIFVSEWIDKCQPYNDHMESYEMQLSEQFNPTETAWKKPALLQTSQELPLDTSVSQISSSMTLSQQSIKSYFTVMKIVKSDVDITKETATKRGGLVSNSKKAWSSLMTKMQQNQRKDKRLAACPPYKLVKGTPFAVDAFSYGNLPGVTAYFLSHFHYDHYIGLNRRFSSPIYCSKITGKLAVLKLGLSMSSIRIMNLNQPITVDNIQIIALESNHCPGAVMFLFKLPTGRRILHTGDFRACEEMEAIHILKEGPVESVYLDTTFCDDFYNFPLQKKVIDVAVAIAEKQYNSNKKLLIIVGSYMIGKEKIYDGIASKLGLKIWVDPAKRKVLECLQMESLTKKLAKNPRDSSLHVLPMKHLNPGWLSNYLTEFGGCFSSVLAFKPTGWAYQGFDIHPQMAPDVRNKVVTLYALPYSEHSSYEELKRFIRFIKPKEIIPTVNADSASRQKKFTNIFSSWKVPDVATKENVRQSSLSHFLRGQSA